MERFHGLIHLPHITMMLEMEQLTLVVLVVADASVAIRLLQVVMVQVE
tara:strand:- start:99 stop:242 length:144 start_codon:yes stop_codon:yes gene_type:complete